jgi:RNA polymerase sigma factor (sigma-70 family)
MAEPLDAEFLKLVNENRGIPHKICRVYFIDASDQDDLLQEMFYQLWKSYPGFDGRAKFSTWMYRVCLNTAITFLRRSNVRRTQSLSESHYEIAEHVTTNREENIELMLKAIATLTPLNKAIILLFLDDMSYEEIAGITGLSKSNVSIRLVRIKKELEGKLKHILTTDHGKF